MSTTQAQQHHSPRSNAGQPQPAPAISTQTQSPVASHEQIERRAYEIYVGGGRKQGSGDADWLEAERQLAPLQTQRQNATPPVPRLMPVRT